MSLPEDQIDAVLIKVQAHLAMDQSKSALQGLKSACAISKICTLSTETRITLTGLLLKFPTHITATIWGGMIWKAESPNPLSARDGLFLKKIPVELKLTDKDMIANLENAITSNTQLQKESAEILIEAWSQGRSPGKGILALLRCHAYLQASKWDQALKDAQVAKAYPPLSITNGKDIWPEAYAAYSHAMEGSQANNIDAALHMAKACEGDPENLGYKEDLERLCRRIPPEHAQSLQLLAIEKEEALPEYKRKRPKYYYYFKWMRERVFEACGKLPAPVIEKLVRIDATELDMLLTYPTGIKSQARKMLEIYEDEGPDALAEFRLPLLTWKEAQQLKAEHALLLESSGLGQQRKLGDVTLQDPTALLETVVEEEDDLEEDLDAPEPV